MRTNYHTHCDFCDGETSAEAMVEAARAAGYAALGFSSHAPLPFPSGWTMERERLGEYLARIRDLKDAATGLQPPLDVFVGLEIDFIPGLCGPRDRLFAEAGLDYRIGSVHFVDLPGAGLFTVDSNPRDFAAKLGSATGGPDEVWRAYFRNLAAMILEGGFDIVGHFDLVRKNNEGNRYFDESSAAYRAAALETASLLAGKDLVVEINVGAMTRGALTTPYPSLEVLAELGRLGVPITISADAHAPSQLGRHLDAARELARAAGYRSALVLEPHPELGAGKWKETGIDEI